MASNYTHKITTVEKVAIKSGEVDLSTGVIVVDEQSFSLKELLKPFDGHIVSFTMQLKQEEDVEDEVDIEDLN